MNVRTLRGLERKVRAYWTEQSFNDHIELARGGKLMGERAPGSQLVSPDMTQERMGLVASLARSSLRALFAARR